MSHWKTEYLSKIKGGRSSLSKLFSKLSFLTTLPSASRVVHTIIFECISIPVYVGSSPPQTVIPQ